MISTELLERQINSYVSECENRNRRPTYEGMGRALGITSETVRHVCRGEYDGIEYGKEPSTNRKIQNSDFETIRQAMRTGKREGRKREWRRKHET